MARRWGGTPPRSSDAVLQTIEKCFLVEQEAMSGRGQECRKQQQTVVSMHCNDGESEVPKLRNVKEKIQLSEASDEYDKTCRMLSKANTFTQMGIHINGAVRVCVGFLRLMDRVRTVRDVSLFAAAIYTGIDHWVSSCFSFRYLLPCQNALQKAMFCASWIRCSSAEDNCLQPGPGIGSPAVCCRRDSGNGFWD